MEVEHEAVPAASTPDAAVLFEAERKRVFSVCFALLHNAQDAEDAAQETFARVLTRLETLNGDPVGYLLATARNVCFDELRRRARRPDAEPRASVTGSARTTAEETAVMRETVGLVWQDLTDGDRRLFAYVFAGLSPREIAGRLGMTAGMVNMRVFRARQRLRRLVPAPATLAGITPRGVLESALRRLRALRSDAPPALLAQLQGGAVAPMLAGIAAGILGGAVAPGAAAPGSLAAAGAVGHADQSVSHGMGLHFGARRAVASATNAAGVLLGTGLSVYLDGFTPSDHYDQDHVLYAQGPSSATCPQQQEPCFSLYRTDNGGNTWSQVSPAFSGQLLMPPGFPWTPTLYALRSDGLARSDDGGRTFALVTAVVDTAHFGEQQARSQYAQLTSPNPLPSPFQPYATLVPQTLDTADEYGAAVQGDVAAVDPTSTPADVRVFVVTRHTGTIAVYDSADNSVQPAFTVALDQAKALNVLSGPGAPGVFVVAWTLTHGVSTYACTWRGGCTRLGPAAQALSSFNDEPVTSPTFGTDQTLWYTRWRDVEQVTLTGDDTHIPLPANWYPLTILPDARYAASRAIDVIAVSGDDPSLDAVLRSVGGGPFIPVPEAHLPRGGDAFDLTRLPDGTLIGTFWPWDDAPGGVICSPDDARSWRASC